MKKLKVEYQSKGNELAHLSNDDIDHLIHDYYHKDISVKGLIKQYDLDISPTYFCGSLPSAEVDDQCPYDGTKVWARFSSRSSAIIDDQLLGDQLLDTSSEYCPRCGHDLGASHCMCDNCMQKRHRSYRGRKQAIRDEADNMVMDGKVAIKNISLWDRLYLAALLQLNLAPNHEFIYKVDFKDEPYLQSNAGKSDDDGVDERLRNMLQDNIASLNKWNDQKYNHKNILIPDKKQIKQVIGGLLLHRIITISPRSALGAFNFSLDNNGKYEINTYNPIKVNYLLNVRNPFSTSNELLTHLIDVDRMPFLEDNATCLRIWKKIALDECKAYLNFELHQVQFKEYHLGTHTEGLLKQLMENFTEGQVFYLIYHSVTKACRYYLEKDDDYDPFQIKLDTDAVKFAIHDLEMSGKRAIAQAQNVPNQVWPTGLKRSAVSQIFFSYVLKLSDSALYIHPNIKTLRGIKD